MHVFEEQYIIVKRILFFCVLLLIFNNIPQVLRLNFIAGSNASKLSFYPLFFLLFYTI